MRLNRKDFEVYMHTKTLTLNDPCIDWVWRRKLLEGKLIYLHRHTFLICQWRHVIKNNTFFSLPNLLISNCFTIQFTKAERFHSLRQCWENPLIGTLAKSRITLEAMLTCSVHNCCHQSFCITNSLFYIWQSQP